MTAAAGKVRRNGVPTQATGCVMCVCWHCRPHGGSLGCQRPKLLLQHRLGYTCVTRKCTHKERTSPHTAAMRVCKQRTMLHRLQNVLNRKAGKKRETDRKGSRGVAPIQGQSLKDKRLCVEGTGTRGG
jgi:hypothetical protein